MTIFFFVTLLKYLLIGIQNNNFPYYFKNSNRTTTDTFLDKQNPLDPALQSHLESFKYRRRVYNNLIALVLLPYDDQQASAQHFW